MKVRFARRKKLVFYKQEASKKESKAKQHPEAELFENYLLSSCTLFKNK